MFATCRACLLALSALLSGLAALAAPSNLADTVKPAPIHPAKLRESDVCMRSLVPRPANAGDPHDTLRALRDFHVTRLEWTYGLTPVFIEKVKALGCTVSGASSTLTVAGVDTKTPEWYRELSVLNLNGEPVEAPWMRDWKGHALWGCVNRPVARAAFLEYVKGQLDMGVTDLQRDDPADNLASVNWGACFCPHCTAGFREYLKAHGDPAQLQAAGIGDLAAFDYGAYLRAKQAPVGDAFAGYPVDYLKGQFIRFQEQSTVEFHRWWRAELNRYAGRVVAVSANNGVTDFSPVYQVFDFFIGELGYEKAQPESLHEAMRQARELGKGLTVTMPLQHQPNETPEWTATIRRTIATVYALGMHIEAPWDTYLPILGETPARFFGKSADYSDLFALVRARPELLDGYVEAAATGGALDSRTPSPVTVWSEHGESYAFTRVRPGQPDAPVVVHLIDWSDQPQPCAVSFDPQALFSGRPFAVSLVTPQPYDQTLHHAAFDTRDYSRLHRTVSLSAGAASTLELPALAPWGVLVLTPLPATETLWPPSFVPAEVAGREAVALQSPQAGAVIRYTTDGQEPAETSPQYTAPLPSAGLKELRARCYAGGRSSAVAVLRHHPTGDRQWRSLLANADFSEGTSRWQSVTMMGVPPGSLKFGTGPQAELGGVTGARLDVSAADGVPYHLRLVQPVTVAAGASLYLQTTLASSRPARVRLGVQEASHPYRVVGVRVFDLGPTPQRVLLTPVNQHPELKAQLQLDVGSVSPGTTVWMGPVTLRERPARGH